MNNQFGRRITIEHHMPIEAAAVKAGPDEWVSVLRSTPSPGLMVEACYRTTVIGLNGSELQTLEVFTAQHSEDHGWLNIIGEPLSDCHPMPPTHWRILRFPGA